MSHDLNGIGSSQTHRSHQAPVEEDWEGMDGFDDLEGPEFGNDADFNFYSGESRFEGKDQKLQGAQNLFHRPSGRPDHKKVDDDLNDILGGTEDSEESGFDSQVDDSEKKQELNAFKQEIEGAKEDFKKTVESNDKLEPTDREGLIKTFNDKAEALANSTDVEKGREDLASLVKEMEGQIQTTADGIDKKKAQDKENDRNTLMGATDEPKFKEKDGHWWQVGQALGEKFKTALQTDNWSDFTNSVSALKDGDQKFVPIMRLVSAVYRVAGSDEKKAIAMINELVPKEAVQAMIDKVTEDTSNLDWKGQGWPDNQDQVGADKWHQWTPRGTADFLRRSLDARRDADASKSGVEAGSLD